MMAITPEVAKSSLTNDQYKLYNLIWKRFIASLMANCVQDTVKAEITGANEADKANGKFVTFVANGYSVRFDGYTCLYETGTDEDEEEEMMLARFGGGNRKAAADGTLYGHRHVVEDMILAVRDGRL